MEEQLAPYLAAHLPGARDVRVSHLLRVPGGASRHTWMFKATWQDASGRQSRQFILQMDPPAPLVHGDRGFEFEVLRTLAAAGLPVPRVLCHEPDPSVLGGAFILAERVQDADTGPAALFEPRWDEARPLLGRHMYEVLAAVHAFDWRSSPLATAAVVPGPPWQAALDHWSRALNAPGHPPQAVANAALRWLRRNPPPPPPRLALVHGDYRVGNILFGIDGSVRGVLDWEMAHVGDPLEDLAWSFLPAWEWTGDGMKGGVITGDEALAAYEQASGTVVDRGRLHWWSVLCGVKWQVASVSAVALFSAGHATGALMPFMAMTMIDACDQYLLRALGRDR